MFDDQNLMGPNLTLIAEDFGMTDVKDQPWWTCSSRFLAPRRGCGQTILGHLSIKTTEVYANWVCKGELERWV